MSKIVHNQKACRKQARIDGIAKMARNVLTPGYCETPVHSMFKDPMLIYRSREEGLVISVKSNGRYCTVFQLHQGSVKKYHNPIPEVDWVCLLEDWSNQISLENNFTCRVDC